MLSTLIFLQKYRIKGIGRDIPLRGVITPKRPTEKTTPAFFHPLNPFKKVSQTKLFASSVLL
jgi:hypothetical protein